MSSFFHIPVLLQSACTYLNVIPGNKYVDATLGGAGHTREIIRLGGLVLGLDQDENALSACPDINGLTKVKSNFIHLQEVVRSYNWQPVAGVLFDLGVSSHQFDTPGRGFSFQKDGPLDMRMDLDLPHSASDLVNTLPQDALTLIFKKFGEEPTAAGIAQSIVSARPITSTTQLTRIIGHPDRIRRIFQALRIAVNDELGSLEMALPQALSVTASGGRIVVISFHSLEDRIVKDHFRNWADTGVGEILTPHPVTADAEEINQNPRSKSAKLRAFIKK